MSLCAAPFLAAPAQASPSVVDRAELRAVLSTGSAHAASPLPLPLPLPDAAPASAAAAGGELARIARSDGPARLLVGVRSHPDLDGVEAALRALGARTERLELTGVVAASVPSGAAAVAKLRSDPRVAFIERDRALRSAAEEFDRQDPETGLPFTWAYDVVHAGQALAAVGGGSTRVVSVLDTGLDVSHPEFTGQVVRRYDAISRSGRVTDHVGHGTFVTGLIAALDGNGIGGKGVAGTTKVIAVRASTTGNFDLSDLIRGIEFSIRAGADVINMSFAGDSFDPYGALALARALSLAFNNNVLSVAAAGNNAELGNPIEVPAAFLGGYRGGGGIGLSVGAAKPDGSPASFSDHNNYVSLAGPGASPDDDCRHGVFSTITATTNPPWQEDGCPNLFTGLGGAHYAYAEGTSFASPIVAGLATLVWQAERRLAPEQVADVLIRSADGRGWNEFTGAGMVDGEAGVRLARVYDVRAPRAHARARRSGNRVRVTVARSTDRTFAGDEFAGHVTYWLRVTRNGGRTYKLLARARRRPFSKSVPILGTRANQLVVSACDRNANCGVKRVGRFRRR
ncbi:MAG TPA: S8 family serine peptidase [Thermoleophilaceae bacterium]|nr:S8 family serine peptidase [Thermoleophilaceae bacterium]